jgi:pyrroline-5-carboxylate reductase
MAKQLIIGAGNMVKALLPGYIRESRNDQFCVYTPSGATAQMFAKDQNTDVYQADNTIYDVIWLGMKPQQLNDVAQNFAIHTDPNTVIISLLAGVTTESISKKFNTSKVVRIMPNTPAFVGEGVNAIFATAELGTKYVYDLKDKLSHSSQSFIFDDEKTIDKITPYSGSGPAYFFEFARLLIDNMIKLGVEEKVARGMIAHTMKGAAQMIIDSPVDVEILRNNVTSKGGVTYEALETFKEHNFDEMVSDAMFNAYRRTLELGQLND